MVRELGEGLRLSQNPRERFHVNFNQIQGKMMIETKISELGDQYILKVFAEQEGLEVDPRPSRKDNLASCHPLHDCIDWEGAHSN